jgi:hypothetical protein
MAAFAESGFEESRGNEFRPTRAVVLSEMSTREKEKYYALLMENDARFYLDQGQTDEIYIANLRILAPGVKKEKKKNIGKDKKNKTRKNKSKQPNSIDKKIKQRVHMGNSDSNRKIFFFITRLHITLELQKRNTSPSF